MRLEKINDKQVRCVISNQDLAAHHITPKELRYGSPETTSLFREIVNKAVDEFHFNEEELPIMIEAIPMGVEGLLLIVTAIEDAEELDPHFATFIEGPEEENVLKNPLHLQVVSEEMKGPKGCVFSFKELEDIILFVKGIPSAIDSSLYKTENGYYLMLEKPSDMELKTFGIVMNTLMESGEFVKSNYTTLSRLKEHEKPIMENVIEKLKDVIL